MVSASGEPPSAKPAERSAGAISTTAQGGCGRGRSANVPLLVLTVLVIAFGAEVGWLMTEPSTS
jgi:hypothetical protein